MRRGLRRGPQPLDYLVSAVILTIAGTVMVVSALTEHPGGLWLAGAMVVAWVVTFGLRRD